ncbi:hypothetical protein ACFV1W_30380 [Kitasatospora sp. NPDC059648]|uniref:hypothetical protein n=1 Tax=Kitasatospora sp. NPDC059648 TaxID=3346894 RepID=UPI0036B2406F
MPTDSRTREGARIVTALETMWAAIQARHPDVPDVVVITGSGMPKKTSKARRAAYQKFGNLDPDRWVDAEAAGRRPELFVAGELLDKGGAAVLETMLHEAAHGIAVTRGIRDRSSDGGRWHNRKFAALAGEVGLEPPAKAAKTIGYCETLLKPQTAAAYGAAIRKLEAARLPHLEGEGAGGEEEAAEGEEPTEPKKGSSGKRYPIQCRCEEPRRMQVTPKVYCPKKDQRGGIWCSFCESEFEPATPEAAEAFDSYEPQPAAEGEQQDVPVAVPAARAPEASAPVEVEPEWDMSEPEPEGAEPY